MQTCVRGAARRHAHTRTHRSPVPLPLDVFLPSPQVWNFLQRIYGGGPALRRKEINIYSPEVLEA